MVLLLARDADSEGRSLIEDQAGLELSLEARFGRPVETVIGCLPEGSYSTHLVYPLGQTWSVPNEAGVCGPTEEPSADGERCGNRTRLPSQAVSIRVGPPTDPVYCKNNPTPEACLP